MGILEKESVPKEARKCSAAQGPHSEVVPRAFWKLVSKSCDECKGSFARGCEVKRWSHWTCSSLGTFFQPMRINSVPDVKCFFNPLNAELNPIRHLLALLRAHLILHISRLRVNNKNVLCVQSMVWHFVHHPVRYLSNALRVWIWHTKQKILRLKNITYHLLNMEMFMQVQWENYFTWSE